MTESKARGYAMVTGASSGIGLAMAQQLAQAGHALVLVARRRARLDELRAEIQKAHAVDVVVIAQDLAAEGAAASVMQALASQGITLEILINNAGYGMQGRFLEMSLAEVDQMCRLNMTTLTHLTLLAAKQMVAQGHGYILNVASAAAFLPSPYVSAYAATKAYVMSFSEALRYELRGTGVSVTTLYPGITTTEFNQVAHAKTPRLMDASILSSEKVAQIGLRAMFGRRRAVVPGIINKLNAFFSQVFHRGFITSTAGKLLKTANNH